jgi:sulfur relay (sulfurtransferase) complex TusBCD TusD component (DsrE family)
MSNMSYCRFQNTASDLSDCIEALQYRDISSSEEKRAAKRMLTEFIEFCEDEGLVETYEVSQKIERLVDSCNSDEEEG